ncbi:Cytochrome p450 [Mycena sanguinolenta]|uniref:Cytochrome p450 n=1 Tax=Mycena sanguinolenta TaxID=230812 RepID=A0A8H6YZJ4_9AGAR|nr:Cytochrome p450 [Mycena sanguinolenta]
MISPMSFSLLHYLVLSLISSILYLAIHSYTNRSRKPLPPGPRGLPLIRNLLDVPKSQEWLTYMEISRKYDSDIISLNLAGETVIVLNSLRAVDDLLEDKSAIYSDRPPFPMLNDLMGFHWHLAFMQYEHRKVFLQQFQPSEVLLHRPVELQAARQLLQRLLDSPDKYERHLRHMAGMIILSTAYGIDVQLEDDPYIDISERAVKAMVSTANKGSFLVDSLPFLKYIPEFFPGSGFKKQAREWSKVVTAMPNIPYDFVKKARVDGTARSSIASRALDRIEESSDGDDEERKLVLRNILAACYDAYARAKTWRNGPSGSPQPRSSPFYNISKRLDEKGIPIESSEEYTSGMACYPIPHECDILPRSEEARVMIQDAVLD